MKKDIEHILNTTRPTLTQSERIQVWSGVTSSFNKSGMIPSPFYVLFHAHRNAFALALIVLVLISGGATVVTAEAARPGDILFPLDQALERVSIRLTRNDDDRGRLANSFAEERLGELRSIVGERQLSTATSTYEHDDARVGAAVDALVRVMDESNMNDTAREKLYAHLFDEIDGLNIDVNVEDEDNDTRKDRERVYVRRDESGSKIKIRKEGFSTHIEKKDGKVRIERKRDDDNAENESREDSDVEENDDEESEVRGAMTGSRDDDDERGDGENEREGKIEE